MEDIDHYEIPIYNFPYDVEEDDEETIADNMELRVNILPFKKYLTFNLTSHSYRPYYLSPLLVPKKKSS
jgi:hypothetical protein